MKVKEILSVIKQDTILFGIRIRHMKKRTRSGSDPIDNPGSQYDPQQPTPIHNSKPDLFLFFLIQTKTNSPQERRQDKRDISEFKSNTQKIKYTKDRQKVCNIAKFKSFNNGRRHQTRFHIRLIKICGLFFMNNAYCLFNQLKTGSTYLYETFRKKMVYVYQMVTQNTLRTRENLSIFLYICAPLSELPPNISTMQKKMIF